MQTQYSVVTVYCSPVAGQYSDYRPVSDVAFVVLLLFYVHSKHLRSCRDGQFPNHNFPGQA